jgi:hypothetical protein
MEGFVLFNRNEKGEVTDAVIEMGGRKIPAKRKIEPAAGSAQ